MGDVYLAENMHLNTQVAIKLIKPTIISNPDARRLFLREAKAAATLDHPSILPLYDYGEAMVEGDIYPYMVMPVRLEGSLKTWLKQYGGAGRLSPATVAEMIDQAASALQHAHDRQIIHLDVKPSNFLLRSKTGHLETPDLLLTDFGLAKVMNTEVSISNTSRGTPPYMAPEQWRGSPVAATDQYALATMAYEMLTGRTPFLGKSLEELMYQHLYTAPEPPGAFNPQLSKEVDEVFFHALAKAPEERFATISAFANALKQALLPEKTEQKTILRATLVISQDEARNGTSRRLDLPGVPHINVDIPAGVHDGQVIRLSVRGKTGDDSSDGAEILAVTISITPGDETVRQASMLPAPRTWLSGKLRLIDQVGGSVSMLSTSRTWLLGALALFVVLVSMGTYLLVGAHATTNGPVKPRPTAPGSITTPAGTQTTGIASPSPSATVIAEQKLYSEATSGKPVLNDPLANNLAGYQWDEIPVITQGGTCAFIDGAYHATQG
jgi:serine/threonine protein kinase